MVSTGLGDDQDSLGKGGHIQDMGGVCLNQGAGHRDTSGLWAHPGVPQPLGGWLPSPTCYSLMPITGSCSGLAPRGQAPGVGPVGFGPNLSHPGLFSVKEPSSPS